MATRKSEFHVLFPQILVWFENFLDLGLDGSLSMSHPSTKFYKKPFSNLCVILQTYQKIHNLTGVVTTKTSGGQTTHTTEGEDTGKHKKATTAIWPETCYFKQSSHQKMFYRERLMWSTDKVLVALPFLHQTDQLFAAILPQHVQEAKTSRPTPSAKGQR